MTPEQVIINVKNKNPQPGWVVFGYNFKFAVSRILCRIFLLSVFLVVSLVFLYSYLTEGKSVFLLLAGISGLPWIISLISVIPVIVELIYSKNNFIVLTEDGIVKSFKGKSEFFPYDVINNLNLTNPYDASTPAIAKRKEQFLDFKDKRNNRFVNLAKNRIFGPPEKIYSILLSKLPLEQSTTSNQSYSNFFNH